MKGSKIIIAVVAVILLILGVVQGYGYIRVSQANKLVKSAEQLVKEKKYHEAIIEYEKAAKIN